MSEEIRYKDVPAGSTYHRMDSEQSGSSMTSLFHSDSDEPSERTRRIVIACVLVLSTVFVALGILLIYGTDYVVSGAWWAIILILAFSGVIIAMIYIIYRQPKNKMDLIFKVPMVPLLPASSVLIDIYLMLSLSTATWIRFGVWMGLGCLIYFGYGIRHSSEKGGHQEVILYDVSDDQGIVNEVKK